MNFRPNCGDDVAQPNFCAICMKCALGFGRSSVSDRQQGVLSRYCADPVYIFFSSVFADCAERDLVYGVGSLPGGS